MNGLNIHQNLRFPILLFLFFAGVFPTSPMMAQTAGNVVCKSCVGSGDIANGSIKSIDIGAGQVRRSNIQDGAINGAKIAKNAVGGSEVKPNSLRPGDLHSEAGADFAGGDQFLTLSSSPTIVRSVSITAPNSGIIIANAVARMIFFQELEIPLPAHSPPGSI